jgi:hypothetical protein
VPRPVSPLPFLLLALGFPGHVHAQQEPAAGPSQVGSTVIDGAPPPIYPEVMTRDELNRATVRAIRLDEPLQVDGALDEAVYREELPFDGLLQVAPNYGAPGSERSDIWVMYDDTHIYVACRCWDSAPPEDWVANELRRDTNALRQNDHFGVMFDTFYDRRSGFMFYANPLGARADYSVIDEGGSNTDWNPVWEVRTGRFDGGWTIEMAIPFKSLRYRAGPDQVWGFQARRSVRHRNEWTYLNPVPALLAGPQALNRVSAAGTLVGLDLPDAGRNMEFKPYGITRLITDRLQTPSLDNDLTGDVGFDFKYGVTAGLTADLTVNTDFAQVEIDEQQVNLTRFSLLFPEKREFFLEGRGVFDFGRGGGGDAPILFQSRRIGLEGGRAVPIDVGGRLTGKVGDYGIGLLNIQTGDEESFGVDATNFTVVRVKRDVFRRSAVGMMFTNRSVALSGSGSNQAYGVDGAFSFFDHVRMNAYWARSDSPDLEGDPESYQATFDYEHDRYGASFERLKVGDGFNPEVGFTRREDFEKSSASLRFSPRPASLAAIRKLTWEAGVDYYATGEGTLESRQQSGRFSIEFENSDRLSFDVNRNYERLFTPFRVGAGLIVPEGAYTFNDVRIGYNAGQQRRISGNLNFRRGGFWDGTITSFGVSGGRVVISNHLALEPGVTINRLELESGTQDQNVFRSRVDYAFTPLMFASALVQYNSHDRIFSSNVRFRWEYQPGSELFVVWTDEHDTEPGGTGLRNRALVIKVTRLFQF